MEEVPVRNMAGTSIAIRRWLLTRVKEIWDVAVCSWLKLLYKDKQQREDEDLNPAPTSTSVPSYRLCVGSGMEL